MADLTGQQLKNSYQNLVTIDATIESNPTSGQLENGLGNPITALGIGTDSPRTELNLVTSSGGIITLENSSTTVVDGDMLGKLNFYSNDASSSASGIRASINGELEGNFGDTALTFSTAGYLEASASERMRIGSTGDISFRDSSASEAFYWDASEARLGIGTTIPTQPLTINRQGGGIIIYSNVNSDGFDFGVRNDNGDGQILQRKQGADIRVFTTPTGGSVTERLRIDSSGNVGIGTDSPSYPLEVDTGAGTFSVRAKGGGSVTIASDASLTYFGDTHEFSNSAGTSEFMRIDSSGNVGIGTSLSGNSANKLAIRKDSVNNVVDALLLNNGSSDNQAGTGVRINMSGVSEANSNLRYAYIEAATLSTGNNHYLAFATNEAGSAPTERMRIDSSGDVILSPSTSRVKGGGTTAGKLELLNSDSTSYVAIHGSTNALPNDIRFITSSNLRMVLTGDGYLRMASTSGGIQFGGDTASANALDDYEEGTWTPTLVSYGGSGSSTYTSQLGTYTKIGRQVVVQFFISFQKNTLSGGNLQMQGLPFTSQANLFPESAILFDNLATALSNPLIQMGASTTSADLVQGNGGTSNHAGLSVDTYLSAGTMGLRGTITYFV